VGWGGVGGIAGKIPAGGASAPIQVLGFLEDRHVALAFRDEPSEIHISPLDDCAQRWLI
jgi:hypothetical protein